VLTQEFRPGDVLSVRCPPIEAQVAAIAPHYLSLRWPWNEVDPESAFRWNGNRAFNRDPNHYEWDGELYRLSPDVTELAEGDSCQVGIPETTVQVISVHPFDPPRDVGWLPRPRRWLSVLPHGQSFDPDFEDQGSTLDPDSGTVVLNLLFRPYAFLEPGDEVADAQSDAWRFDGPWNWHSFSGRVSIPTWPLTLLSRNGDPEEEVVSTVMRATTDGSHAGEESRWRDLTNAELWAASR
jgi:hypothetical protein